MRLIPIRFFRLLLVSIALYAFLGIGAVAQTVTRFIQVTDPHLFRKDDHDVSENKEAFKAFIRKINERVEDDYVDYKFIVVTGDLGIEDLMDDDGKFDEKFPDRAEELAEMLAESKVKLWLFVPGNNDLRNESPKTINLFHHFIETLDAKLRAGWEKKKPHPPDAIEVTVKNFCPVNDDPTSGVYTASPFVFIGFNNASFKNNNDPDRATETADEQLRYVEQVISRLNASEEKFAYTFYHIPEIDDPYRATFDPTDERLQQIKTKFKEYDETSYEYSAWTVRNKVRMLWEDVVKNEKVKGLFAGHFHDSNPETYKKEKNYAWMATQNYPYDSTSKLYVCPPISFKQQYGKETSARGFQEVTLDNVSGDVRAKIFWYGVTRSFNSDPIKETEQSALTRRSSELGDSTYLPVISLLVIFVSVICWVFYMHKTFEYQKKELMERLTRLPRK